MAGAEVLTDIGTFARNLIFLAQTNSVGYLIAAKIQDWVDDNPDYLDLPLSQDDINAMLKALTGCVVGCQSDMNCYPLGHETTLCFDLSGNPT